MPRRPGCASKWPSTAAGASAVASASRSAESGRAARANDEDVPFLARPLQAQGSRPRGRTTICQRPRARRPRRAPDGRALRGAAATSGARPKNRSASASWNAASPANGRSSLAHRDGAGRSDAWRRARRAARPPSAKRSSLSLRRQRSRPPRVPASSAETSERLGIGVSRSARVSEPVPRERRERDARRRGARTG